MCHLKFESYICKGMQYAHTPTHSVPTVGNPEGVLVENIYGRERDGCSGSCNGSTHR